MSSDIVVNITLQKSKYSNKDNYGQVHECYFNINSTFNTPKNTAFLKKIELDNNDAEKRKKDSILRKDNKLIKALYYIRSNLLKIDGAEA